MDYRGRIYPRPNYLTYQGGDLARSLLLFADGRPVGNNSWLSGDSEPDSSSSSLSTKYFLHHLANVYGETRRTRKGRIGWANSHSKSIVEAFLHDRELFNREFLSKAKEKAQFISCVLAIIHNFTDKIPVLFDASCSGLQHLAALTTDPELGTLVNVCSSAEGKDFYKFCAEKIEECIYQLRDDDLRESLIRLLISRRLVKPPVMTTTYGVTLYGMVDQISNCFEKEFQDKENKTTVVYRVSGEHSKTGKEFTLTPREIYKLASIIFKVVNLHLPTLNPLKEYFEEMVGLFKLLNLPLF